jgi:hypothetical protein
MSTRLVVCALVVVVAGCSGGDERRPAQAPTAPATATPASRAPLVEPGALLGVITPWSGNAGSLLAPVDRRSLEAGVPWADLGEYHAAWSVSPDGRMAAFGISAAGRRIGIGIRVIDLATLRTVKDLEVGIVAEAVGWLAPDRLAAFLQSGEVVVVDPLSGREVSRKALGAISCPFAPPSAVTRAGFVLLTPDAGVARLVVADGDGRVRSARLTRFALGEGRGVCERAGLAVDRARLVAYVVGARTLIAEVDLRTMRVREHRLAAAPRLLSTTGCPTCGAQRAAVWLGGGRLAVAGVNARAQTASRFTIRPGGAAVVDTRRWTGRSIARHAGAVLRAGDHLVVYDGRHPSMRPRHGDGLRVHDRSGRLRYTTLEGERVGTVQIAGGRAYAFTTRGVRVVDLERGRVIARFPHRRRDVQLLAPR